MNDSSSGSGIDCRCVAFVLLAAILGAAGTTQAQLTPDQTYYGINHPMSMKVAIPKEARAAAAVVAPAKAEEAKGDAKEPAKPATDPSDAVIELYAWDDTRPASSAHVVEGGIDLAAVFPELWTATPRLLYAQLKVGETKIGSPVVLQPMVTPRNLIGEPTSRPCTDSSK